MDIQNSIQQALEKQKQDSTHVSSLSALKSNLVGGIFAEQQRKKKEEQVKTLLQNALFLEHDEDRKIRWISILSDLSDRMLEDLMQAIIRENIRYKKKERDIVIELNKKQSQISIV